MRKKESKHSNSGNDEIPKALKNMKKDKQQKNDIDNKKVKPKNKIKKIIISLIIIVVIIIGVMQIGRAHV